MQGHRRDQSKKEAVGKSALLFVSHPTLLNTCLSSPFPLLLPESITLGNLLNGNLSKNEEATVSLHLTASHVLFTKLQRFCQQWMFKVKLTAGFSHAETHLPFYTNTCAHKPNSRPRPHLTVPISGIMVTLASQAEIGVWVQAPEGLLSGWAIIRRKILRLLLEYPASSAFFAGKRFKMLSIMRS